jgi:DNA helicase-2/ATP-dependent DNA helicase PcrA
MTFKPTPEQEAIVAAGVDTPDNLLVSALAGAAKTSTLVLLAEAMQGQSMLCLAFNKKIQLEMQDRLPEWCTAMTLNSYGHRAWGEFLRRRLQVDARKNYKLIREWAAENLDGDEARLFWEEEFDDVKNAVAAAKTAGYIPERTIREMGAPFNSMMTDDEFDDWLDFEPSDNQIECILDVLHESVVQGLQGRIDYDDQILLSTMCASVSFQRWPVVLVDEAQDLSALNHQMLWKMTGQGRSRVIAVGDECQAIYGFRGAHENSMTLLKERFNMTELSLSISFRCPTSVVKAAHWRAPNMQWPEWAQPGEVKELGEWSVDDIPEHAAIICRNNAPLFALAFDLLRNGRVPEIWGGGLDKFIIKVLKSLGSADMLIDDANTALDLWVEREKAKRKDQEVVEERGECIRIFLAGAETLGQAITAVEQLFAKTGPIKLMTGHKAKGLEFDHVFILNKFLIRQKLGQERNLLYVMQTRAKETLTYVKSENFLDLAEPEKEKEISNGHS